MINCIIFKEQGGQIAGIQIEGHSPKAYGNLGENLLCAGVSTLTQSVHSYLVVQRALASETKKDGFLEFLLSEDRKGKFQTLLEMTELALHSLQKNHPDAISIQNEIIKG
ncbi:ribosomal-processing cysteine protease Prp [Leptospira sp. 96542]|nr:ribosomal-processing cysteine protease Prp [Leptospira sp. 96542]